MMAKKVILTLLVAIFTVTNSIGVGLAAEKRNIFQRKTDNGEQAAKVDLGRQEKPSNIFQKKSVGAPAGQSTRAPVKKETLKPVKQETKPAKPKEPAKPKIVRADLMHPSQLTIPAEFGSVKEHWPYSEIASSSRSFGTPRNDGQNKIIIHIQDAHCNYEAQMNLARMLEYLYLAHGLTLVMVEGGSRSDSLSYMREYAPKEKRIEVADKYLKSGKICGENYLDIVEEYPIDVFGIEKPELYDANMNSFLKLDDIRDRDLAMLDNLRQTNNALKQKLYSKELLDLEAKKKDYTDEKMKFKDYVVYLSSYLSEKEIQTKQRFSIARFIQRILRFIINLIKKIFGISGRQTIQLETTSSMPNMMLYAKALDLEKRTDLKQTELERAKLLEYLTRTLPQAKMKECLAKTQEAKDNKIKQSEYYNYLKSLLVHQSTSAPVTSKYEKLYPNLFAYIDYLTAFDKIDNEELFKELPVLEDYVYTKLLGKNKDAEQVYFISRAIETFEGLIEIKITPDETRFYTEHKPKFKVSQWKEFLAKQAKKYGIATNIDPQSTALDSHLAFVDSFYGVAKQREDAFVANSIRAMDTRLPVSPLTGEAGAFKPKDPNAPKLAVLIAGGYHTATLTELFKKNNLAYAVVAPNVTTATDKTLYRTVLKEVYTPMSRPAAVEPAAAEKPVLPGLLRQQNNEEKK